MVEADPGLIGGKVSHEFVLERNGEEIEIGHCFQLGTQYSQVFDAKIMNEAGGGKQSLIHMGCYGIGISRIFATAAIASNATLNWPLPLAPHLISVIPRIDDAMPHAIKFHDRLVQCQQQQDSSRDIILDDRAGLGLGHKIKDAQRLGIPFIAIVRGHDEATDRFDYKIERLYDYEEVGVDAGKGTSTDASQSLPLILPSSI